MTITAKNYAAQAEAALRKNPLILYHSGATQVKRNACCLADKIKKAVHFAIPDGGKIFDDDLKGLAGVEIHLPYPEITLEFFYFQHGMYNNKFVVHAEERHEIIRVSSVYFHSKANRWVYPEAYVELSIYAAFNRVAEGFPLVIVIDESFSPKQRESEILHYKCLMNIVFEFLEALSCKNITTANLQEEAKALNQRRIKKGKLPFYETKILVIDTKEKPAKRTGTGTHASPRQHLRRGHIRRLPSGNYWVNSCVVGDAEKGSIHKQYAVL